MWNLGDDDDYNETGFSTSFILLKKTCSNLFQVYILQMKAF